MANFAYTRAGGIWATGSDLLSAELADLDSKTHRALNAEDGGAWTPSSVIILGGAGLQVDGAFVANANAEFNAQTQFNGPVAVTSGNFTATGGATVTLDAGQNAHISAGQNLNLNATTNVNVNQTQPNSQFRVYGLRAIFDAEVTFNAGPVRVNSPNSPNYGFIVQNNAQFHGVVRCESWIDMKGGSVVGWQADQAGDQSSTYQTGYTEFGEYGRILGRPGIYVRPGVNDPTPMFSARVNDWIYIPDGANYHQTANRPINVASFSRHGDHIGFTNADEFTPYNIHNEGGSKIITLYPKSWCQLKNIHGAWIATEHASFFAIGADYFPS